MSFLHVSSVLTHSSTPIPPNLCTYSLTLEGRNGQTVNNRTGHSVSENNRKKNVTKVDLSSVHSGARVFDNDSPYIVPEESFNAIHGPGSRNNQLSLMIFQADPEVIHE